MHSSRRAGVVLCTRVGVRGWCCRCYTRANWRRANVWNAHSLLTRHYDQLLAAMLREYGAAATLRCAINSQSVAQLCHRAVKRRRAQQAERQDCSVVRRFECVEQQLRSLFIIDAVAMLRCMRPSHVPCRAIGRRFAQLSPHARWRGNGWHRIGSDRKCSTREISRQSHWKF